MYTLAENQKTRAKEEILSHFKQEIDEITHKTLASFAHANIQKIEYRTGASEASTFKIFSIYQVAVIYLYQTLCETASASYFANRIETIYQKEDVEDIINTACEFGEKYLLTTEGEKLTLLNKTLIDEIKRAKANAKDDLAIDETYAKIFTKEDTYLAKTHLSHMIDVRSHFEDDACYELKCFSKKDVFSLLILYRIYQDESLIESYQNIKSYSNIATSSKVQEEIKSIANDYIQSKDKSYLSLVNHFFIELCDYIKHEYFIGIQEEHIDKAYAAIEEEVKTLKWHNRIFLKKDTWLFNKNTITIQKELKEQSQTHDYHLLTHKIFDEDFKTFSSVIVLVHEYDYKFQTIDKLGELLNQDFSGYFDVAGMNIKNYYEASTNELEIEAVNRFLLFWMQLNEKVLHKKMGHSDK